MINYKIYNKKDKTNNIEDESEEVEESIKKDTKELEESTKKDAKETEELKEPTKESEELEEPTKESEEGKGEFGGVQETKSQEPETSKKSEPVEVEEDEEEHEEEDEESIVVENPEVDDEEEISKSKKIESIMQDYNEVKDSINKSSKSNNNLSQKNYNEIELSKIPNNNVLINLPRKTNKIKLKIKNKKMKEEDDIIENIDEETITKRLNIYKKIKFDECVDIKFLTKIWRSHFPEKTVFFSFNNMLKKCNYNLLIYILKSYNSRIYNSITISNIKDMLIKFYKNYAVPKYYNNIHNLWKKQNKGNYNLIESSIENIIKDENYKLTAIDILLISDNLKIPIVVFFESKKNIKLINFTRNNTNKVYYFIKAVSRSDNMYLTSNKKSLRFKLENLSSNLQDALINNKYDTFEDYLVNF